jgi:hypothetical protein
MAKPLTTRNQGLRRPAMGAAKQPVAAYSKRLSRFGPDPQKVRGFLFSNARYGECMVNTALTVV